MSELKPGWKTVHISRIADHCLGKMLDKKKNRGELKPYLRNLNVRWFDFDLSDVLQMRFEKDEADRYQAQKGDLIVCEGGYPGRASVWQSDEPIYLQKALHRIRFHEPNHAKWVLYWLYFKDINGTLADSFSGTGIQHFTKAALARFELPLPPLDEQKRIVAVLDQVFAALDRARAHAEANLADAGELIAGATEQIFPNDRAIAASHSLGELCEAIIDCEHKTAPTQDQGIPSIRTPNVGKGILLLSGVNRVSEETYREWTRRAEPRPGDLILAREAPAGNVAVIPEGMRVCLGQRTVLLRPKRDLFVPAYLAHMLLRSSSQARLLAHSRGATVQHINVKDIRAFRVSSLPSLAEQGAVVRGIEQLMAQGETLMTVYTRKLADLANLRQSLLQKAFSGELA